jgi:hypothetical protein
LLKDVEEHAEPQHAVDAARLRAVRIVRRLALRVVLAMDRRPLLGHHAGGEPQPKAEEVRHRRVQVERAMRLVAMQVDRHGSDRDLDENQPGDHVAPPGQVKNAGKQHGIHHR